MADKVKLSDFLSQKTFKQIEKVFRENYDLPLEICDNSGRKVETLCSSDCKADFCQMVGKSRLGKKKCSKERLRSINIAIETGQPYICICHAGIVLACIPIMEKSIPLGGLFLGKCLFEKSCPLSENDILTKARGVIADKKTLIKKVRQLNIFSPRQMFEMSNYLFVLFYETSNLDPQVIKWRNLRSQQQSQISDFIQEGKQKPNQLGYPYNYERQLIEKVKIGDRIGSRGILNCMLATIILENPGRLDVLKAKMLELLSVLSRAAVEGGAELNLLLNKNLEHIQKLIQIENQPDLCAWTGKAIDEFIELVYATQDAAKITQIKPAVEYMENNYDKPISLSDVASSVHLSISRLAHVFKEQMGITVVDYLTKVRIDKAKQLLSYTDKSCTQICFEVGYNNQSYFTRMFKQITSLTPKQFRKLNHF